MRKILFLALIFVAGRYLVQQLLGEEQRERLARLPATMMERCMEAMPEALPPRAMMSGLGRIQEQNEEILSLLREQNEILRERLPAGG